MVYRKEIDGLRALAISSVLIFHAGKISPNFQFLSGGYLGVDIFFVISGYLISKLILEQLSNNSFSINDFYARRARRILPVVLIATLLTTIFANAILDGDELKEYLFTVLSSLIFASNVYFSFGDPYWANESVLQPLLHTWSLGVEEQFYLLCPFILIFFNKFSKLKLIIFWIILIFLSLALAQWASANIPEFNFFLLPSRAWELGIGAFLASISKWELKNRQIFLDIFLIIIIVAILLTLFTFTPDTRHPSLLTLLPVLLTGIFIFFGNNDNLVSQVLGSNLFRYIGTRSYAIYIYHFPIFSLYAVYNSDIGIYEIFFLIFIVIIISELSFKLLETPLRYKKITSNKFFILFVSITISLTIIFTLASLFTKFQITQKNDIGATTFYSEEDFFSGTEKPYKLEDEKWQIPKNWDKKSRIILVGDSHIESIAPQIANLSLNSGIAVSSSIYSGCQLIIGTQRLDNKKCSVKNNNQRLEFIKSQEPSIVILGGRLTLVMEEERFKSSEGYKEGGKQDNLQIQNIDKSLTTKKERQLFITEQYKKTVNEIINAGHKVIVVYPIPEIGVKLPKFLRQKLNDNETEIASIYLFNNPFTISFKEFKDRNKNAYAALDSISYDIERIFPSDIFCNSLIKNRCITHDLEGIFYRDGHHLSEYGAFKVSQLIFPTIKKLLLEIK